MYKNKIKEKLNKIAANHVDYLQEEESRSCKKHFMRVFSNSCSKELQKA
jgi:hypothetical protein